jgi:parallel beta-helix repeat protein
MTGHVRRLIATIAGSSLVFLGLAVAGTAPAGADGTTRYVATTGSDASNNCLTQVSPCKTLGHALSQSTSDNTILLAPGTYATSANPTGTSNTIPASLHDLTIDSNGGSASDTIIDATSTANGLVVHADHVTVQNITVRNADLQGIFVTPPTGATAPAAITDFTLSHTTVTNNDRCSAHPTATDCPAPSAEDDYGEGVQLLSVVNSTIDSNTVTHNFGGILVTDEMGPNHGNTISNNTVSDNTGDCGITLASHNPAAVATSGTLAGTAQPAAGGVYDNTITGNTTNGNGAAGIIMAGPIPGTAAYHNTISNNTANDNGLAGISIHSHTPFQDMNDNAITGNHLSHDALTGNNGTPGDSDAGDTHTTGILVLSSAAPITGTVVTGNTISDVFYGVWLSQKTPTANVSNNTTTVTAGGTPIFVDRPNAAAIVGMAHTPSGNGYWVAQADGEVFPFGDAPYYGSLGGANLAMPVVGIASTPSGHGYWLVASDGGIFSFGDAHFYGSTGNIRLNQPVVGMAAGPSGAGYWFVAADGGVFSYGSARFHGSMGAVRLNRPVVGMTPGPSGAGYWLVASDGGIFSFGTAPFHGSTGALRLAQPVVGMTASPTNGGYWFVARDGGLFSFGDSHYHGSVPGTY